VNAREVALQVVRDVFPANGAQRTAQEALDYRVRAAGLDARDRAFATELAYGAIKMRRALDWRLAPFLRERASTIPQTTREVLRLAVYELRYTRADTHATVYEFVEIAKRHGHRGLTALANAVLRAYLRDPPPEPDAASFENEDEYLGTLHSLPTWLVRHWRAVFGNDRVEAICVGVNTPPQHAITANLARVDPAALVERFSARGVTARPSPFIAESLVLDDGAAVREGSPDGSWWVQSESSAIATDVLQPQPGEQILDLCSGRGNKALQIAGRLAGAGALTCVDRDARKISVLQARLDVCGVTAATVVADARRLELDRRFDRVLLDAPCSGAGVVGRHPEARWTKQADDGSRLAPTQAALLEAAAPLLHEGGVLVYAVCSTDPREGVDVVNGFLGAHNFSRGLVPARLEPFLTPEGDVLVPPGIDGRDGFYVARVERSL
jgi:16S rRNA (cytosine967-C5)-methyltransferase